MSWRCAGGNSASTRSSSFPPGRKSCDVRACRPPRLEGNGFPAVFNIEADPREEVNILGTNAWVIGPYLKLIGEYQKTLDNSLNPQGSQHD